MAQEEGKAQRKKRYIRALAVAAVVLLIGLGVYGMILWKAPAEVKGQSFSDFLSEVNETRQEVYDGKMLEIEASWKGALSDPEEPMTEEELTALMEIPDRFPDWITRQQAKEDVETVFFLLRQSYACYDYFGGDPVFEEARKAVLAALPEEERMTPDQLMEAFSCMKEYVNDNHLAIGGMTAGIRMGEEHYDAWYVPQLYFDDPAGVAPELVAKTIDEEGRIRYTLVALKQESAVKELPQMARIEGKSRELFWEKLSGTAQDEEIFTADVLENGTPVLISRSLTAGREEDSRKLEEMAACGSDYRDEPVLIWDLCSNVGGSDLYFSEWLRGYSGKSIAAKVSSITKVTALNCFFRKYMMDQVVYRYNSTNVRGKYLQKKLEPYWEDYQSGGIFRKMPGVMIVLQDAQTASAGESAIAFARSLQNTITVGSNTFGIMLAGNDIRVFLPHSGLRLQMGITLSQFEECRNPESIGWMPDLWVPTDEAMERVEKMIDYYDISSLAVKKEEQ